jgi:hypothetical protein
VAVLQVLISTTSTPTTFKLSPARESTASLRCTFVDLEVDK